jgi:serine/threonine-protein kinase RsbW
MQYGGLSLDIEEAIPPVVRASGELDSESFNSFESALRGALEGSAGTLCLALEGLTFVDSVGIRALAKSALEANKSGRRLSIISMTSHLDHLLTVAGLKDLFAVSIAEQQPLAKSSPHKGEAQVRSFEAPRDTSACRTVREQVCEFAQNLGFDGVALEDIRLAIGEAVSNAVRHGAVCGESIEVHCKDSADRLVVTLTYASDEFDPGSVPVPTYATATEGGMGIHFMKLVMDRVRYEFLNGRTELTLEKMLAL